MGGLLNRKSVYPVMTADTEGFIVSTFYSLSLTFSCLNFPVVFSRWTSDFWRGNCSCSACIKNTLVREYNLDYMIQELYVVFSNSNWQWRYVHKMCSTLYSILYYLNIFYQKFLTCIFFRPSIVFDAYCYGYLSVAIDNRVPLRNLLACIFVCHFSLNL